jgi:hypothetical protein
MIPIRWFEKTKEAEIPEAKKTKEAREHKVE